MGFFLPLRRYTNSPFKSEPSPFAFPPLPVTEDVYTEKAFYMALKTPSYNYAQRSATPRIVITICVQGIGILFRSVKFLTLLTYITGTCQFKPVLCYEIFKKWPLLSLFPGCIRKILPCFSLNSNFGTFNSCSGLFPFRHTTLSYYVREFKIYHRPSESKSSLIKSSRSPNVYKLNLIIICPRSQFYTCNDII